MNELLDKVLNENSYYNLTIMPFDYAALAQDPQLLEQLDAIMAAGSEEAVEEEKYKLLKLIYTKIYELNLTKKDIEQYFQQAILTEKFKIYLGMAFKFAVQYNKEEDTVVSTFIHLAQFFMSDICYEYLWKLEHQQEQRSGLLPHL